MTVPRLVVAGDPHHGVVAYGRRLAAAVAERSGRDVTLAAGDATLARSGPLHLQFTDRLWGASPEEAGERVAALAAATPLTVTLHDLPQASDGPRNLERRADCYRRVVAGARGVVVSSAYEAALLAKVAPPPAPPAVIPLPVDPAPDDGPPPEPDDDVCLLGFFYPGKGHAEAVDAVADLAAGGGPRLGVTALGRASAGHEDELATLVETAAARGVRVTGTGWLEDGELHRRCRRAGVPLVAHRHVSASASLSTWIAAGRRPLVPDAPYWRELAALRPGTVTPYAPEDLPAAIARARRDPATTWLAPGTPTAPGPAEVADAHLAWWSAEVAW